MSKLFTQISLFIQRLAKYPSIGKLIGSFLGLLEVPILELFSCIDRHLHPGSYQKLMNIFTLFYGSKIIPLGQKIEAVPTVAPTEELLSLIRRVPAVSLGYCYCRTKNRNCTNPLWTCIHIGTAKSLAELGKKVPLRTSSVTEVESLLHQADDLGLVHQLLTAPTADYVYVICNCCPCCCVMLSNYIKYNSKGVATPSAFIINLKENICTDCGLCITRCHFGALQFSNEKLTIDYSKCVGCGLCLSKCPADALSLERR